MGEALRGGHSGALSMSKRWLFGSFFLGGYECSTHVTVEGRRLDIVGATQHDKLAREDYRLCRSAGIRAVREAARWPLIDHAGNLDLESVRELARVGREEGVIQIWDLMHYGYPDELDPFEPAFRDRFVAYARAVARTIRDESDGPIVFTPINEISYYSWAGGDVGYMAPSAMGAEPRSNAPSLELPSPRRMRSGRLIQLRRFS